MDLNCPQLKNVYDGTVIRLTSSPFTIGRALSNSCVLENKAISRTHCALIKTERGWIVEDKSTNGTIVNGTLYQRAASDVLKHNDVISLSQEDHTFKFLTTNEPDAQQEVVTIKDDSGISDEQLCAVADDLFQSVVRTEVDNNHQKVVPVPSSSNPTITATASDQNPAGTDHNYYQQGGSTISSTSICSKKAKLSNNEDNSTASTNLAGSTGGTGSANSAGSSILLGALAPAPSNSENQQNNIIDLSNNSVTYIGTTTSNVTSSTCNNDVVVISDDSILNIAASSSNAIPSVPPVSNVVTTLPVVIPDVSSTSNNDVPIVILDGDDITPSQETVICGVPKIEEVIEIDCEPSSSRQGVDVKKNEVVVNQYEEMENELQCAICSELFVKATTLNCSHTYCKQCINQWRKNKQDCPICRQHITSATPTLVLDNVINKMMESLDPETQRQRKELVKQRENAEQEVLRQATMAAQRGRGQNRGRRGNNVARQGNNAGGRGNTVSVRGGSTASGRGAIVTGPGASGAVVLIYRHDSPAVFDHRPTRGGVSLTYMGRGFGRGRGGAGGGGGGSGRGRGGGVFGRGRGGGGR